LDWSEDPLRARLFSFDFAQLVTREMMIFDEKRLRYSAFMPLYQSARNKPGPNEFLGVSVLNVQYFGSCIMTELVRYQMECACDRYLPDFTTIVDLSRHVLWFLYKSNKTEPVWVLKATFVLDRTMAASVATWLMKTEEEGIPTGHVPEMVRWRIVRTYLILDERKVVVVCSKLIEGPEERVELPEQTISW
jgi:hypothetical protein